MAKLRINGDSSGYVDLEAPNAASSSTLDLDQVPQKNAANTFSAVNNFTGNIGINRSTPQSKFEAWTGNGELSHFGSNNANATNNYTGISLGYAEAGANSNYRKVGIVAVGRGDGAARQDLAFLVDSNSDGNSVDLGDTKMRISHEGYVTTPQQPAFHASGGSQQTAAGIVQFTTLMTNTGNHYNSSNYRFTAPTTGVYKFSARIMKAQNATVDFHFRVNGSQVGDNIYDTATATNQLNSGTANMVRHLNSGDYVQVYSASTSTVNWIHAGHREFSGYLIG